MIDNAPGVRPDPAHIDPAQDVPFTPHRAYCIRRDAARGGDDLVTVVHAALCTWPRDEGLRELAELIVCASLGYWTEGGGR
jgi:hypothetical protein